MGSIESKNQSAETATASKSAEQENGHVKTNGDAVQKPNGDATAADAAATNGSAEPVTEEAGTGETIEQAPPANGDAKPEEPPGKQGKKKKFSFKKPFKLPFRKNKKEAAAAAAEESPAGEEAAPAAEEAAAASSPKEENVANAEEPQKENVAEPASAPEEASTAPEEAPAAEPEPAAAPAEQSEASPSTEPAAEPPKEE